MNAALSLTRRELVRTLRQPTRLIALLGTVLLFWIVVGSGFARSFVPPSLNDASNADTLAYTAYLMPGMVLMIVLFSTIVWAITLIQDRHEGFLQSVLVSPAPAWAIVFSKTVAGVLVALVQAVPILLAAPLLGVELTASGFLLAVLASSLAAGAFVCLGLILAWRIDSIAGFHGVMNLVLLPMWLLSGAIFPVDGAAGWMRLVMLANPLHWAHRAMAGALDVAPPAGGVAWAVASGFALATALVACGVIGGRSTIRS
jgi:ABC-2 type transport system permease protein